MQVTDCTNPFMCLSLSVFFSELVQDAVIVDAHAAQVSSQALQLFQSFSWRYSLSLLSPRMDRQTDDLMSVNVQSRQCSFTPSLYRQEKGGGEGTTEGGVWKTKNWVGTCALHILTPHVSGNRAGRKEPPKHKKFLEILYDCKNYLLCTVVTVVLLK